MITVNINKQSYSFSPPITVGSVLEQLKIGSQGIAVAVNNCVVTRSTWTTQQLDEGDKVMIIQATQGG
ncbi:sulfur carrier protein ThiS [Galbibacter sp. EGI 63066]|uniref:sulfur carrier protein ThiS n=1 Tax=Galbibacter sp. EGI 63066 TaxID=2993559 RepID=UPI002249286B|nr:sulfur carrier protein ThiS [Galbibacter sp. EGI 63066]MCX2678869.1 sulfur carrier protein ThiS [Galbibacter sp. EGI 63066]